MKPHVLSELAPLHPGSPGYAAGGVVGSTGLYPVGATKYGRELVTGIVASIPSRERRD